MDVRCRVADCDRNAEAAGLCMRCYKREWRLKKGARPQLRLRVCTVEGCGRTGKIVRGLCRMHYARWQRHGDALVVVATVRGSVRVESVEFNGITFRRYPDSAVASHRRYFSPGGQWIKQGVGALHQEVWKAHHGPIPPGWHVHHRGDYGDNSIDNLECLPRAAHEQEHSASRSAYGTSARQLAHLDRIRHLASAWHRSPAGREWHRQHARNIGFGQPRARVQPDDD